MRNAITVILSVALVAGALSAAVATATVHWIYPSMVAADSDITGPAPGLPPAPTPATAQEQLALDLIRRAGSGDLAGAHALAPDLAETALKDQVAFFAATPLRAARLPSPPGDSTPVLIWAEYRADGQQSRGMYQVTVRGDIATALKGPLAPPGGLAPLALTFQDEAGRKVKLPQRQPLILVAPRLPRDGLTELLAYLNATYSPQGIGVALVIDTRSPDWAAAARAGGYQGPIWYSKDPLEDAPVVSRGEFLGAYGLLVNREGQPVASLAALNPLQYDLRDTAPADIIPVVLRAYGLLP